MKKYLKWELIILDDFLLHTITDEREIKILFELLEKRNEQRKSTIVCSQRNPASWKAMILNDEVSANSIIKRVTKRLHYQDQHSISGGQLTKNRRPLCSAERPF